MKQQGTPRGHSHRPLWSAPQDEDTNDHERKRQATCGWEAGEERSGARLEGVQANGRRGTDRPGAARAENPAIVHEEKQEGFHKEQGSERNAKTHGAAVCKYEENKWRWGSGGAAEAQGANNCKTGQTAEKKRAAKYGNKDQRIMNAKHQQAWWVETKRFKE